MAIYPDEDYIVVLSWLYFSVRADLSALVAPLGSFIFASVRLSRVLLTGPVTSFRSSTPESRSLNGVSSAAQFPIMPNKHKSTLTK